MEASTRPLNARPKQNIHLIASQAQRTHKERKQKDRKIWKTGRREGMPFSRQYTGTATINSQEPWMRTMVLHRRSAQGWRSWGTLSLTELFSISRSREWEVIAFHHVPTGDYTIVSIQSNGHTDTSI